MFLYYIAECNRDVQACKKHQRASERSVYGGHQEASQAAQIQRQATCYEIEPVSQAASLPGSNKQ
jgi:hypothetical protein